MFVREGPRIWRGNRDEESWRHYYAEFVVGTTTLDGPANVLQCPGLPVYGDQWIIADDIDVWATCRWKTEVESMQPADLPGPTNWWRVLCYFTNKPDKAFCLEQQIENPLLMPPKLSGGGVKYTEELSNDRFGNPLVNSAWEVFNGPKVEFDANRGQVHIEMNVPQLLLPFVESFRDRVNGVPIWGINARCVKLSDFKWSKNYYGVCFPYYTWIFDFDINFKSFDRPIYDEGTKVLNGKWDPATGHWVLVPIDANGTLPSPLNPAHFMRFVDRSGNVARVMLDGLGLPAGTFLGTGTSTVPSCITCSGGTPISVRIEGLIPFSGDYAIYNQVVPGELFPSATDPCEFTATVGSVKADLSVSGSLMGGGLIFLSIQDLSGEMPRVIYLKRLAVDPITAKWDCCTINNLPISVGDSDFCPIAISYNPNCSGVPGPPFTGPPAQFLIQAYDEADFSLLGIPLVF